MCKKAYRRTSNGQSGFSVIELIVAIVIFTIVTGSIYGLLQIGRIDRNRSSRRSDVLKNARVAIHLIGRDALNAGLGYNRVGALTRDDFLEDRFGLDADPDDERDFITSVIPGNDHDVNDLSGASTDFVAFCARDMDFNPRPAPAVPTGTLLQLQDVGAGASATVPRVRTKAANGAAQANAATNHLYLVESDTGQVAVMATGVPAANQIDAEPGDPLDINQPYNGTGQGGSVLRRCNAPGVDVNGDPVYDTNCTTYVATLKKFSIVSYHIDPDGSLIRRTYGNNTAGVAPADQIQQQVLAYNVSDFQIEYVLADGTVTNAPTIASPGPDDDWNTEADNIPDQANLIRQINISITVMATERDEQTTDAERITLQATFSTRNMEYTAG